MSVGRVAMNTRFFAANVFALLASSAIASVSASVLELAQCAAEKQSD
jgi:hypothetical protein